MARTNLPLTNWTAGGVVVTDPAGTTVDPTNGHVLGPRVRPEQLVLRVNNTAGTSKTVTLKASTNTGHISPGQGDLVMTVPATSVRWLGPFESDRYSQPRDDVGASGGYLFLDLQSAITGTITAFLMPRNA